MRTTLNIDEDVLAAARGLAGIQSKSIGAVISSLVRKALRPDRPAPRTRNGVPLLELRAGVRRVTPKQVHQLREGSPL